MLNFIQKTGDTKISQEIKARRKLFLLLSIMLSTQTGQKVVPICLPTLKFADAFDGKDAVMAGYGRRENPFCMTDMMGPQAFEICGSPQYCKYNDPGLRKCGLDFIYKGKKRRSCMKTEPPSSQHPLCKKYKETHLKNNSLM